MCLLEESFIEFLMTYCELYDVIDLKNLLLNAGYYSI